MKQPQRVFDKPILIKKICAKCGKEYTAKHIMIGGEKKDCSLGWCQECFLSEKDEWEKEQEQSEMMARTAELAQKRRQWREEMIPPLYLYSDFSTFKTNRGNLKNVHKACLDYANNFPCNHDYWVNKGREPYPSMFIYSKVGTGKTHLACAITHRILDKWDGDNVMSPVIFITEGDIYRRIRATYNYSYEEKIRKDDETDIVNRLIAVPLLIIDDLAKDEKNDMKFVRRIMFSIIDGRDKANKPIVVTSNKDFDQLAEYLKEDDESPCCDRLFRMTTNNQWEIISESYRVNPIN